MSTLVCDSPYTLPDPASTEALGARLASHLRIGDVVALEGPLGAGKTHMARAMIRTLADDPSLEVPSPTFTLVQTYDTPRGDIWHVDLYRLSNRSDALELGLEEAFETAITLIEWPDRLGQDLPRDCGRIALSHGDQNGRIAVLSGPLWRERLA